MYSDIIGWIGTALLILTTFLISHKILHGNSKIILVLQILTNLCLLQLNYVRNVLQGVIINLMLLFIIIFALIKNVMQTKGKK